MFIKPTSQRCGLSDLACAEFRFPLKDKDSSLCGYRDNPSIINRSTVDQLKDCNGGKKSKACKGINWEPLHGKKEEGEKNREVIQKEEKKPSQM